MIELSKKSNPKEIIDSKGKVNVPDGYAYCMECAGLTPHVSGGHRWSSSCLICGNSKYGSDNCPNCGWEPPEDIMAFHEVTIHHPGCHCDTEKDNIDGFEVESTPIFDLIVREFKNDWMRNYPDRMIWGYKIGDPVHQEYERRQKRLSLWHNAMSIKCGCPRYIVYTNLNIFNYRSGHVYSQDCMNAMEWSYDIRCSICGEVYRIADGNC